MQQERPPGVSADDLVAASGDEAIAATVTIDEAYRVVAVRLVEDEKIRSPEGLAETFAAAYTAALRAHLESMRRDRPLSTPGTRPRAVATLLTFERPTTEQLSRHRIREESRDLPRARTGDATGISTNDCVRVTLAPAQPIGPVDADRGWLAHAHLPNIAKAITEAFQAAYTEREN